jgi:hypothetical protein
MQDSSQPKMIQAEEGTIGINYQATSEDKLRRLRACCSEF